MMSPASMEAPPHTTPTFTDPSVALTVPCELTARLQTGNFISVSERMSRHPASMTSPLTPCARSEVASNSPKYPSVQGDVGATTMMSPAMANLDGNVNHQIIARRQRHRDRGPGDGSTRIDWAHISGEQAATPLRFMHG